MRYQVSRLMRRKCLSLKGGDQPFSPVSATRKLKAIQFRFDATNILNHPLSGDPAGLANAGSSLIDTFGLVSTKTGNRQFQGTLKLTF